MTCTIWKGNNNQIRKKSEKSGMHEFKCSLPVWNAKGCDRKELIKYAIGLFKWPLPLRGATQFRSERTHKLRNRVIQMTCTLEGQQKSDQKEIIKSEIDYSNGLYTFEGQRKLDQKAFRKSEMGLHKCPWSLWVAAEIGSERNQKIGNRVIQRISTPFSGKHASDPKEIEKSEILSFTPIEGQQKSNRKELI